MCEAVSGIERLSSAMGFCESPNVSPGSRLQESYAAAFRVCLKKLSGSALISLFSVEPGQVCNRRVSAGILRKTPRFSRNGALSSSSTSVHALRRILRASCHSTRRIVQSRSVTLECYLAKGTPPSTPRALARPDPECSGDKSGHANQPIHSLLTILQPHL